MAGYSKRTLVEKLGIKPSTRVIALSAPSTYAVLLGPLPAGSSLHSRLSADSGFIHKFVRTRGDLAADFPRLSRALTDSGTLWISWPKRGSGVETDLTENIVREIGLKEGLVDVKVCALDDVWSGLKFVRRVRNRAEGSRSRVKGLGSNARPE
jgi:hypothetical protein